MSVSVPAAAEPISFRPWFFVFGLLFGLAGVVRFAGLGRFSFDGDEIFSLQIASLPWQGVLSAVARDVSHPPLFYLLLKAWIGPGWTSETWTRLLPALLGWATVLPLYGIGRTIGLRKLGLMLLLGLFTFNGPLIYYAQHLRMFSLLELTSAVSMFFFLRLLATGTPSLRQFHWLTSANLVMVYSHYWGWFVIFAELATLAALDRRKVWRFILANGWVAVGFLPWSIAVAFASLSRGSLTEQIDWISQPDGSSFAWLIGDMNGAPDFSHATRLGIVLFGLPVLVLLLRLASSRQFRASFDVPPWSWLLLFLWPIVATWAVGVVLGQSVWGERQLIISFVPYFVLVSIAASRLPGARLAGAAQIILLLWSVAAGASAMADDHQKLDWREMARMIAKTEGVGGQIPIYTPEPFIGTPLTFYFARLDAPLDGVTVQPDLTRLAGDRFWFVYRDFKWTEAESPEAFFKARGLVVERRIGTGIKTEAIIGLLLHRAN